MGFDPFCFGGVRIVNLFSVFCVVVFALFVFVLYFVLDVAFVPGLFNHDERHL